MEEVKKHIFGSGAYRNPFEEKIDFEGFLSPSVIECYANYMHKHRAMEDGTLRESDNWQKGIPIPSYMKSLFRHFFAVWKGYRTSRPSVDDLCGVLFNAMGMLHEVLKDKEGEV